MIYVFCLFVVLQHPIHMCAITIFSTAVLNSEATMITNAMNEPSFPLPQIAVSYYLDAYYTHEIRLIIPKNTAA